MKKYIIALAALLITTTVAQAAPVSWDFTSNILRPLQSMWNSEVRVPWITATSTTATSTLPLLSGTKFNATTVCVSGDCRTAWPTGGGGGTVYLASTSAWTVGNAAFVASNGSVGSVATGTLTETVSGLELSATRGLLGGAAVLSLTSGFTIPSSTLITSASAFHASPSSLCTAITGSASLCDGVDDTAAGGSGLATTSPWTIGQLARVASNGAVSSIATSALALLISDTVGTLGETRGGTNQTTYATGDILYASSANTLAKRAIGSTGNVLMVQSGIPTWVATSSLGISGGGTVYLASSSPWTAGNATFVNTNGTIGSVATGTLTETVTGLELSAERGLFGGSAILSLTSGFVIPSTTLWTNVADFYTTPSTRITAGTGLSWSGNTLNASGGSGTVYLASTTGYTTGGVAFATGPGGLSTRATTTLVAGTGVTFSGGTPIILGSSPITIEATGGSGGSGLATTTDVVGDGGSQLASYVTGDVLLGGSSSTTAEFQFDDDGAKFIISSSSQTATATIAATNNTGAIQMGVASTTGSALVRGLHWSFLSSSQAIVNAVGGITDLVFAVNPTFTGTSTHAGATFSGNVGIGTTTAPARLTLTGTVGSTLLRIVNSASTALLTIVDNVVTALGAWDFGGADSLEIPNGTNPTVDATGELAVDTTANELIIGDNANTARALPFTDVRIWSGTFASTSDAFISGGLLPVGTHLDGYTITRIQCHVTGGTSKVIAIEDASANSSEDITCGTTNTTDDGSITNATYTASELQYIDFGATTGAVNYVTISVFGNWSRQ